MSVSDQPNPVGSAQPTTADLRRRLRWSQRLNVVLAVVAAFLLIVVVNLQIAQSGPAGAPSPSASAGSGQSLAAKLARNQASDPMAWGDPKAPVVMVQWTDFRCPFCATFAKETLPVLYTDYINTGKVRFEVHDVAFFGDQSVDAAVAVRAAGEQGKYHEFMTVLYAAAPASGHPDLPPATLIGFAEKAQVPDLVKFKADLASADLRKAVTESTSAAQKQGVSSVPFFVIGDSVVSGAQPLLNFKSTIEAELAKK